MNRTAPSADSTTRRIRWLAVFGLIAAVAVLAGAFGLRLPTSSSTSGAPPSSARSPGASAPAGAREPSRGELGAADGVVPDGVTVFDDTVPAVSRLDPELLRALRRAATSAADDGAEFHVNSGWRSPKYQEQLFRQAVAKYGSEDEAARWVATTATSPHVAGDAADIGESDAADWLSEHGADYGLCQIYRNEPWHYELRADAADHGCPRMYADPTQDPRMQK
ncbi:M15 family metallopeptidase [Streptomyces formicae]|uniref:M15 family metallopeptidase n=1 Tax=Streptomyces formicae TaxID=1616117 RepID=UPI000BF78C0C|nr:M15 family metallopeptidase [Streptomyces formicae]